MHVVAADREARGDGLSCCTSALCWQGQSNALGVCAAAGQPDDISTTTSIAATSARKLLALCVSRSFV
jgi:hypothetical protein